LHDIYDYTDIIKEVYGDELDIPDEGIVVKSVVYTKLINQSQVLKFQDQI